MQLSNDLLSQFAKVTNDKHEIKKETTVYGTVRSVDGQKYVQMDGSELLTPCDTTTAVEVGDRVAIQVKNHTATITGNMSSPAVKIGRVEDINGQVSVYIHGIEADKAVIVNLDATYANIRDLNATNATIKNLEANKADIKDLEAVNASIENLEADSAKITSLEAAFGEFETLTVEQLAAKYAFIAELDANEIDTDSLDAKYANITFTNIEEAAITNFLAKSGMIEGLIVDDAYVTKELVGVTISGDLIKANTIQADKLVVRGDDGLYYALNYESGKFKQGDVVPTDGLHGSIIVAKSITAEQIQVSDLNAFGATIGGFKIDSDAIRSAAKDGPNNTTRGIYLDNEGQFAVGDTNHFIKYYKQADGTYKFEILADSLKLKTANKTVDIGEFGTRLDTAETEINQNKEAISLKASESYVTEAVKSIDVGARNLLLNTSDPTTISAATNSNKYQKIPMSVSKLTEGQVYTFTANVDISAGTPVDISLALYNTALSSNSGRVNLTIVDGRISGQITAGSSAESFLVYAGHAGQTSGNVITLSNMKLEKGNKATDWSPAPEDYYTKEQTDAKFTVTSESITSTVSKTYATKQEVNDLEVGACNLILNSDFSAGTNEWVVLGVTASAELDTTHGTCLKITSPAAGSADYRIYPNLFRHTGGTYSLSFYAKADTATSLQTNVAGGTGGLKNYDLTTSWKRYTHTYDASSGSLTFWLNNANTTAYITKVQIERGDKVTDWSLAPDDVPSTKDLEDSNADLNNRMDGLDTRISEAASAIQQLSDAITMLVTDENGVSLMTQTENGWTFSMGNIQNAVNKVSQSLDNLEKTSSDTGATVESLKQSVADMGGLTKHINVGTYTYKNDEGALTEEPSIEWSKDDTEFKLIITNTQALFMDGAHVPTKINTYGIITDNLTVEGDFRHGSFVWAERTNGNYGLMWKGVIR